MSEFLLGGNDDEVVDMDEQSKSNLEDADIDESDEEPDSDIEDDDEIEEVEGEEPNDE